MKLFEAVSDTVRPDVLLAVTVLAVVYILGKLMKKKKNLPPGPICLPIVGYLPFLTNYPHLKLIKLGKKYGGVFSIYLGSEYVVILNDAEAIREAFSKKELLPRPPFSPFQLFKIHTPFFTENFKMWQEQRRFVVQTMKDLGLGKSKIEGHIQDEILYFLKYLEESSGKPMNLMKPLTPSMSNNICSLVFGERYNYNSEERIILDNALESVATRIGQTGILTFFPWLKKVPFLFKVLKFDEAIDAAMEVVNLIGEKIRKHKESLDPTNIRDFIDSYLLEIKNKETDPETTFSEELLTGCTLNLFGAGSETVRTSISWSMYIMAAFPEVQRKVQKEIEEVLGSSKFPQFPDQKDMPYTQAVTREIMRWKTVVPLNLLRYSVGDTEVSGYHIPKGTVVIANFWAAHHDPKYWKDPESFKPERFLDSDGTLLKSTNYFMPFSVGKRSCPGETMAMMEVFLYFVAILQKFQVSFPKGFKPTYEAELGISFRLKPFQICFTLR